MFAHEQIHWGRLGKDSKAEAMAQGHLQGPTFLLACFPLCVKRNRARGPEASEPFALKCSDGFSCNETLWTSLWFPAQVLNHVLDPGSWNIRALVSKHSFSNSVLGLKFYSYSESIPETHFFSLVISIFSSNLHSSTGGWSVQVKIAEGREVIQLKSNTFLLLVWICVVRLNGESQIEKLNEYVVIMSVWVFDHYILGWRHTYR